MDFVDQAEIHAKAGDGGPGCVSFRRERFVPKGGPDGGDGGKGGDIVFRVNPGQNTLRAFRRKKIFRARNGQAGRGKNQHGRNGRDVIIEVPPGTMIKDPETGMLLADLTEPGQTWIAARGGLGGRGNARFATATRQAPRYAQPGIEGQERRLSLELKLIADIGLVGEPNAGKSTLLARISAARPKIADYPFTTLVPNLGVVELSDHRTMVVADIPGLIEGAHRGTGMGLDFLRHVERTRILLNILDVSQGKEAALNSLQTVMGEVGRYHRPLLDKPWAIALNKIDVADPSVVEEVTAILKKGGFRVFSISAVTGKGIPLLLEKLYHMIEAES
ncbi:MAG TPA: GTPase ObgE [Thermodesulfobacteriaceae bacterium]|nr:GTPase ObgE [Thermodesulfobacteriaceae bacterium]